MALKMHLMLGAVLMILYFCHDGTSLLACTRDFCDRVNCTTNITKCPQNYTLTRGVCNCCNACLPTRAEGGFCRIPNVVGFPPSAVCEKGLTCCFNTGHCSAKCPS